MLRSIFRHRNIKLLNNRTFSSIERRINSLGYKLPKYKDPTGSYHSVNIIDDIGYISGHLPFDDNGDICKGTINQYISNSEGKKSALLCGLNILSTLKEKVGLDNIEKIVKLTGFVNTTEGYKSHAFIMDGCSNLFLEVFEENGIHSRSTIGVKSLPFNAQIEVEGIIKLKNKNKK